MARASERASRYNATEAATPRYAVMANDTRELVRPAHGAMRLPEAEVLSYNVELKDDESFVGDRANKGAFRGFLEKWRKSMREVGQDPFGEVSSRPSTGRPGCLA
jgi:hypothetical protein